MRTQASFHGRGNAKRLMHAAKVVVHVEQRNHRDVIVELLAEGIRQPSEAAHIHSHVEILALHKTGGDVRLIWVADDFDALGAKTLCGAVAFLSLRIVAEDLHQLRVVDLISKRIRNGKQVHLMAVRGQLDSVRQPASNILKEVRRTPRIPPAYSPTDNKLRVRVNCGEGPNVSSVSGAIPHGLRNVLLLGRDKAPNLIDLDTLRRYVANSHVLVLLASLTDAHQQPKDSALRHASQPNGRANRAPFDQRRDDRDFLVHADYVCHNLTIRHRFRIVNSKVIWSAVLLAVLDFCPTRFSGLTCATFALFVGHGFKPTLAADLAAFSAHLSHDLLDYGKFNGFRGFQKHAPRVLDGIKFWSSAFPLWHIPKRCMDYGIGQEGTISNRPTTEKAVAEQNIGFAALQVPDSGPVGRTVAAGKIGPRIGEEVSVDVNDHYFPGCPVPCPRLCTCNEALSKLFRCSLCSHKHRES